LVVDHAAATCLPSQSVHPLCCASDLCHLAPLHHSFMSSTHLLQPNTSLLMRHKSIVAVAVTA